MRFCSNYSVLGGGKGSNQTVDCACAGGKVAFLRTLGQDSFADPLRLSVQESGVQLALPTGAAFISVSETDENAITVASGVNAGVLPESKGFTHLVMQPEIPLATVVARAQAARAAGVQVILNAAPARGLPPELLSNVVILVVNEGELALRARRRPWPVPVPVPSPACRRGPRPKRSCRPHRVDCLSYGFRPFP